MMTALRPGACLLESKGPDQGGARGWGFGSRVTPQAGKRIVTLLPLPLQSRRQTWPFQIPDRLSRFHGFCRICELEVSSCRPEGLSASRANRRHTDQSQRVCSEAVDREAYRRVACMINGRGEAWPTSPTATPSHSAFRGPNRLHWSSELGTRLGLNAPTIPAVCFGLKCTTSLL